MISDLYHLRGLGGRRHSRLYVTPLKSELNKRHIEKLSEFKVKIVVIIP